jgi:hypothetical protein
MLKVQHSHLGFTNDFSLIHQDISASSRSIFSRVIQNAADQTSDMTCCEALRPVLSLLASWPTSFAAELLMPDVLPIMRICFEV